MVEGMVEKKADLMVFWLVDKMVLKMAAKKDSWKV